MCVFRKENPSTSIPILIDRSIGVVRHSFVIGVVRSVFPPSFAPLGFVEFFVQPCSLRPA